MSDWTPDQPLRHDATDEEMKERFWALRRITTVLDRIVALAREFARAVAAQRMAERDAEDAALLTELFADPEDGEWCLDDGSGENLASNVRDALRMVYKYWGKVSDACERAESRLAAVTADRAAMRAEVERLREAGVDLANQLESVTLIGEDAELRPDAMSYQKPSEFKAYAVYALRTLAARETPDA